jgi:hypothetical protein
MIKKGVSMKFSDEELKAIQRPGSPHYELSATFSVCLAIENDIRAYDEVNRRRRVDGTIKPNDPDAFRASGTLARTVSVTLGKPLESGAPARPARQTAPQPRSRIPATLPVELRVIPQRPQAPIQGTFPFRKTP